MVGGTSKIDITPETSVWMDGMIRSHKSLGVHDRIFALALVLSQNTDMENAFVIVSVEVCGLKRDFTQRVRNPASEKTGIPAGNIVITATHTHSGPAAIGFFNPPESDYLDELAEKLVRVIYEAAKTLKPVTAGFASGKENTISYYRRLMSVDGHIVMNWETYPPEKIVGPLGEVDPEVGVLKVAETNNPKKTLCILFNHAGHPNVMSGDNYLISGDYPGLAMKLLEKELGCTTVFVNGAMGTMDIDGLRDRDWEGVERTGKALAAAVSETAHSIELVPDMKLRTGYAKYTLPPRKITRQELSWAEQVLKTTGGKVQALADGVGDDYKALLFKRLHDNRDREITVEQTCAAVGGCALITFPGELFTEIGLRIKKESPFTRTYIIGLANGEIGYIPTKKAIGEGGYAVETREAGDNAEEIIVSRSLELLDNVYRK